MAYRVGLQTNDRKFFHEQLKIVLETPPSVWPEQRLANEVAHRKARRYLTHERRSSSNDEVDQRPRPLCARRRWRAVTVPTTAARRERRAPDRDARALGQPVDGGARQGARPRSRRRPAAASRLKYFEGGQQGDERDFVRKIKLGQLDGAAVTAVGLSMIDESIRVLELPMMFETVEELDYVADKMWPYFQKKFEKKGFKLNDRGEVGWIYFLSKNKVESLADLKGQKLWMWGDDQLVGAMFKKLGLNGVPLGVPEVDAGLTSGRINAATARRSRRSRCSGTRRSST